MSDAYPRPSGFSPEEWQARVQLAAYRIFDRLGKPVLLLRNHGPVVMGHTLAQAFSLMWLLQRACEVQLASQSMGAVRRIPVPVLEACVRDSLNFDPAHGDGQDAFDAMQRLVDVVDPG